MKSFKIGDRVMATDYGRIGVSYRSMNGGETGTVIGVNGDRIMVKCDIDGFSIERLDYFLELLKIEDYEIY